MGGEACGIGEGTHYGCECVMRRLAEAEARAASEQARRETAERERDEANATLQYAITKRQAVETSLSAALRRAEGAEERERIAARAVADECARANRNESRAEALARALRDLTESVTAYGEKIAGPEPRGPWPIWPVAIRDALIEAARALSVGVSRTGTGGER
jgi:hypothetical protein